ncbi:MAG TPA: inositol monophosphatase [Solirubrobacteraceae bacterium]|nr:inositol monophosphatase [Solirubrobacteraceae bacterium]
MGADALERLTVLEDLAAEAGALALAAFRSGVAGVRRKRGPHDLVTDADERVERMIAASLAARFPQDGFAGEESTSERASRSGITWTADPVDGTWNFAAGIPQWCVVIACADEDGPLAGVTFDPVRDELWGAARGAGLCLNGVRLGPRPRRPVADSTWAAALGGAFREPRWQRLMGRIGPVRLMGSLGLDLAWTAAGRFDALAYTCSQHPWDVWAGTLMALEQGLDVWRDEPARLLAVLPRGWRGELRLAEP